MIEQLKLFELPKIKRTKRVMMQVAECDVYRIDYYCNICGLKVREKVDDGFVRRRKACPDCNNQN
jgi:hypothetical protein